MGRGRAKAKQTKVARELKYRGSMTDLDALRAELVHTHVDGSSVSNGSVEDVDDDEDDDRYDPYALDDDEATSRRWNAS
jgi:hypothetical protein